MSRSQAIKRFGLLMAVGVAISACNSQQGPAQKMIADVQAAVDQAGPEAAKFVPDQLADVQTKLGEMKASYDKKDYKAVLSEAPPVMGAAQGLASAATAKKELLAKGYSEQWAALTGALPADANSLQNRIDFLSKPANKKLAAGVDLDAARASLLEANSLWSKAQAASSSGNMADAINAGKSAKAQYEALAASMKLDFAQPAAVQDTTPNS